MAGEVVFVEDTEPLSIARFEAMERLQMEANGMHPDFLLERLANIFAHMDVGKNATAAVLHMDLMRELEQRAKRGTSEALMICAIFFLAPGEDRAVWDEVAALEKIELWRREGLKMDFFTKQGRLLAGGFWKKWLETSPNTSEETSSDEQGSM